MITHLKEVGNISRELVKETVFENNELYAKIAYLNGIAHDFGKSTSFFQNRLNFEKVDEKAYHSLISAFFGFFLIDNFLKKNNLQEEHRFLPAISWLVISRHHGNLNNIRVGSKNIISKIQNTNLDVLTAQIKDIKNNKEVQNIYFLLLKDFNLKINLEEFILNIKNFQDFSSDLQKQLKELTRTSSIDVYSLILFFYSVLLDADKLNAAGLDIVPERILGIRSRIIDNYKKAKFRSEKSKIDKIREQAYEEMQENVTKLDLKDKFYTVTLPTGAGKTLTGLSLALKLREKVETVYKFSPRIIYALPFLSIIDQNSETIKEILTSFLDANYLNLLAESEKKEMGVLSDLPSNLYLTHHHLSDIKYIEMKQNDEIYSYKDFNTSLLLTEGWHSEIIITTFVQLFHSLFTNRNRAIRKFHNIANSIILLDEVQNIPIKYWGLIRDFFRNFSAKFNCWVILMTATQPMIFEEKSIELVKDKALYFEEFDRFIYYIDLQPKDIDTFLFELVSNIDDCKNDIMVVVNTIGVCKKIYEKLKNKYICEFNNFEIDNDGILVFPSLEIINLTTHILPYYRLRKIKRIKADKKRKIIITTQLIEAGVDISVDEIYRDLAPLDSIVQTAGRCNRESKKKEKGTVKIIQLIDENQRFFHSYIYDPTLINISKTVLDKLGNEVTEREFNLKAINMFYELSKERKAQEITILKEINMLNFDNVSQFSLIEKDSLKTISVYIEIDVDAVKIRKKLTSIMTERKGFEKREELLKIRSDLNKNLLSINCNRKTLNEINLLPNITNEIRYIPYEILKEWYSVDSGFKFPESTSEMRII
ncbi:MAG: CRISPR-associated helicase Cas3' [Candidatus Heimdallarchaeota archaeon]|nr:CRISPR-associated helicase Cas3' [Candidatus Heimdallarchaeota archaeon]MCK4612700.1 CRISPR-associated helicase Cas3' [Candidatus Heimdallarchaeota archaeon]